ncbi:MAG: long-chain fatty acid transport protein [Betaproteobacteria bacterium]|jgi:long-chain fatty acid transport protein|nr:long-chain fatty acid transport protein [Betaproteobacteria bacterium]
MNNAKQRLIRLSVAAALAAMASGASAAGFQLMEQNASGLGNAYAGQGASAQDASTIFFNPAGMTYLPGKNVVGAINAIRPSAQFSNTTSTLAPLQTSLGGNGGDAGDWAFVPNAYFSWQLNSQLFVGLGLNAPFGLKTEYDPAWVGRFHAIESELKTININPSIAFRVNNVVSLGAGVSYQKADATLTNAVNYSAAAFGAGGVALLGAIGGAGKEGVAKVEGDDWAWGYNFGAMFDISPDTRAGVAYRSSTSYKISGTVAFSNRPALLAGGLPDGPVTADITLPATASVNLFHKINPQWELLADLSWTEWSRLKTLNIVRSTGALLATTPLNWRDTWRVGVGANYNINNAWTLRVGTAYDQSPVPDADRTPRIPDQDRVWLAIGAQYRLSKQAAIDFGYAHLFVKDGSVNLCNAAQAAANPAACAGKNNLVGTFQNDVNILSTQLRYTF